jgi:hypothetical protein
MLATRFLFRFSTNQIKTGEIVAFLLHENWQGCKYVDFAALGVRFVLIGFYACLRLFRNRVILTALHSLEIRVAKAIALPDPMIRLTSSWTNC